MKKLILIIKGFIIGTANIVPGVSGGSLMMSLGIFEDIIYKVNHFLSDIKENIKYFLCIIFGILLSLIIMSRVITFSLDNYHIQTILFFVGLIIGGIPLIYKKINKNEFKTKYLLAFIIPFILIITLSLFPLSTGLVNLTNISFIEYIILFIVGLIAAASMVVPGLSGSFILILLGYYEPIINSIKDLTSLINIYDNFIILFIFGLGVLTGIFFIVKLIEILLDKYKNITYYAILGFILSSIISIFITNFSTGIDLSLSICICSVITFLIGSFIAYKLGE